MLTESECVYAPRTLRSSYMYATGSTDSVSATSYTVVEASASREYGPPQSNVSSWHDDATRHSTTVGRIRECLIDNPARWIEIYTDNDHWRSIRVRGVRIARRFGDRGVSGRQSATRRDDQYETANRSTRSGVWHGRRH